MLRGIQPTTTDGVVLFDTIFPGHYIGRTPHIHGNITATSVFDLKSDLKSQ